MGFARRTLRFGGGMILGAAVGTTISVLFAPQRGDELQASLQDRKEAALRAGEEAEVIETERLKNIFRATVSDPTALTGRTDPTPYEKTEAEKAAEKLEQERKEAAEALADARKAEADVRKAQEEAEKQREKVQEARDKADKARDKARSEEEDVIRAYDEAVEKSKRQ